MPLKGTLPPTTFINLKAINHIIMLIANEINIPIFRVGRKLNPNPMFIAIIINPAIK